MGRAEICGRYHLSAHRSLRRAPLHAWQDWFAARGEHPAVPGNPERFRISFMPIIYRKLSRQGIAFNRIQYWDNVLPRLARMGERILLRYDPRDLSRLYAMDDSGRYWPVPYADLTLAPITLAEARAAIAGRSSTEKARTSGTQIVKHALEQRELVRQSRSTTRRARRDLQRTVDAQRQLGTERHASAGQPEPDFGKPPPEYPVEIWESE